MCGAVVEFGLVKCQRESKVPPKIKELIEILEAAGFQNSGRKGSHRNYKHPNGGTAVTTPSKLGDDAKHYLIKAVKIALEESKNENK